MDCVLQSVAFGATQSVAFLFVAFSQFFNSERANKPRTMFLFLSKPNHTHSGRNFKQNFLTNNKGYIMNMPICIALSCLFQAVIRHCLINVNLSIESFNKSILQGQTSNKYNIHRKIYGSSHIKPLIVPCKCQKGNYYYKKTLQGIGVGAKDHKNLSHKFKAYPQAPK